MKISMIAPLVLCLALGGCSSNQILITLEASVAAAEVLVNTLPNIPPDVRANVSAAVAELPQAFQLTARELDSTDSAGVKAAKITAYYADTLVRLKALPPAAQIYAVPIVNAINAFLKALYPVATSKAMAGPTSPALQVSEYKHLGDRIFNVTEKIGLAQR